VSHLEGLDVIGGIMFQGLCWNMMELSSGISSSLFRWGI